MKTMNVPLVCPDALALLEPDERLAYDWQKSSQLPRKADYFVHVSGHAHHHLWRATYRVRAGSVRDAARLAVRRVARDGKRLACKVDRACVGAFYNLGPFKGNFAIGLGRSGDPEGCEEIVQGWISAAERLPAGVNSEYGRMKALMAEGTRPAPRPESRRELARWEDELHQLYLSKELPEHPDDRPLPPVDAVLEKLSDNHKCRQRNCRRRRRNSCPLAAKCLGRARGARRG